MEAVQGQLGVGWVWSEGECGVVICWVGIWSETAHLVAVNVFATDVSSTLLTCTLYPHGKRLHKPTHDALRGEV